MLNNKLPGIFFKFYFLSEKNIPTRKMTRRLKYHLLPIFGTTKFSNECADLMRCRCNNRE